MACLLDALMGVSARSTEAKRTRDQRTAQAPWGRRPSNPGQRDAACPSRDTCPPNSSNQVRVPLTPPRGRLGTFGAFGNHDYGERWQELGVATALQDLLARHGLQVLRNEAADVGGLRLIGLEDLWSPGFDPAPTLDALPEGAPAIVLSHNPDAADEPVWGAFAGWILAGHTHGGQCRPPFLPPPLVPVRNKRYTAGRFDLEGGRHLYITAASATCSASASTSARRSRSSR